MKMVRYLAHGACFVVGAVGGYLAASAITNAVGSSPDDANRGSTFPSAPPSVDNCPDCGSSLNGNRACQKCTDQE